MLFAFAEMTTTVTETVTVTPKPIPDYLVEVSNLETSAWTGPVVFTLVVGVLAVFVSIASIAVQFYTWLYEGAFLKLRIFIVPDHPASEWGSGKTLAEPAVIRVSVVNKGRKDSHVGPVFLAKAKGRFWKYTNSLENQVTLKNLGQFPSLTFQTVLIPGQEISTLLEPDEVWWLKEYKGISLKQIRLVTYSFNKPIVAKIPKEVRKELVKHKPSTIKEREQSNS